ncbi:MAG TPA: hypothetical protein VGG62_07505 [Terracidiphilus sp.]
MPVAEQTNSRYLRAVNDALQYVRGKMDIGASNKPGPGMIARMLCAGGTFNKGELRERVDQDLGRIPHPTYKDMLESSADWAKHFGCGNCGEQSALAFVYLRDLGIRPLDWIQVNNFKHAFVVVGRVSGSDPEDYTTWGRSAYYCDPWLGDSGEAAVLHVRYWRKKMALLYRLD